ncbi:MAG: hypothetical protein ACRD4A_04135, partial [Candidatus Acidiferrales bacterium]
MTLPKSSDTGIMPFFDLCRRIAARLRVRTRYTRALEDEVARLRAENHALMNSILGVAGIAPMRMASRAETIAGANYRQFAARGAVKTPDGADAGCPKVGPRRIGEASHQPNMKRSAGRELQQPNMKRSAGSFESQDKRELQVAGEVAVPLRKRSWQQIERLREIEDTRAVRRERET